MSVERTPWQKIRARSSPNTYAHVVAWREVLQTKKAVFARSSIRVRFIRNTVVCCTIVDEEDLSREHHQQQRRKKTRFESSSVTLSLVGLSYSNDFVWGEKAAEKKEENYFFGLFFFHQWSMIQMKLKNKYSLTRFVRLLLARSSEDHRSSGPGSIVSRSLSRGEFASLSSKHVGFSFVQNE